MNVIDFPTGTITHLTLQSKATDLYSRARQLSPAPFVIVSQVMDDGREVGDGEDDVVGCGELDLVVLSWLKLP